MRLVGGVCWHVGWNKQCSICWRFNPLWCLLTPLSFYWPSTGSVKNASKIHCWLPPGFTTNWVLGTKGWGSVWLGESGACGCGVNVWGVFEGWSKVKFYTVFWLFWMWLGWSGMADWNDLGVWSLGVGNRDGMVSACGRCLSGGHWESKWVIINNNNKLLIPYV